MVNCFYHNLPSSCLVCCAAQKLCDDFQCVSVSEIFGQKLQGELYGQSVF